MKSFCTLRNIYRSIREFELKFQQEYGLCLNDGMLLCSLESGRYSSSEIAEMLGLTNSNTSKVIKAVEGKGYIERILGQEDKRQMYFVMTDLGREKLLGIKCNVEGVNALLKEILTESETTLDRLL